MSHILDTDHCVAILRGRLKRQGWVASNTSLFITAVTVSELVFGAHRSERLTEKLALVDELLEIVTVLPFDTAAARRHAELKETLRRVGMPLAELDLQIASIVPQPMRLFRPPDRLSLHHLREGCARGCSVVSRATKLAEQRLCFEQVGLVKPFCEPGVDSRQHRAGFLMSPLLAMQVTQAQSGAQLP